MVVANSSSNQTVRFRMVGDTKTSASTEFLMFLFICPTLWNICNIDKHEGSTNLSIHQLYALVSLYSFWCLKLNHLDHVNPACWHRVFSRRVKIIPHLFEPFHLLNLERVRRDSNALQFPFFSIWTVMWNPSKFSQS